MVPRVVPARGRPARSRPGGWRTAATARSRRSSRARSTRWRRRWRGAGSGPPSADVTGMDVTSSPSATGRWEPAAVAISGALTIAAGAEQFDDAVAQAGDVAGPVATGDREAATTSVRLWVAPPARKKRRRAKPATSTARPIATASPARGGSNQATGTEHVPAAPRVVTSSSITVSPEGNCAPPRLAGHHSIQQHHVRGIERWRCHRPPPCHDQESSATGMSVVWTVAKGCGQSAATPMDGASHGSAGRAGPPERPVGAVLDRRGSPSRRRPARRGTAAGCATAHPCRRGGRGAIRCCTAPSGSGPDGSGGSRGSCVGGRRERSIPPCSAIARSRLENFHNVDHDAIHTTYISGRCTAIDEPSSTSCTPATSMPSG